MLNLGFAFVITVLFLKFCVMPLVNADVHAPDSPMRLFFFAIATAFLFFYGSVTFFYDLLNKFLTWG